MVWPFSDGNGLNGRVCPANSPVSVRPRTQVAPWNAGALALLLLLETLDVGMPATAWKSA